MLSSCWILFTHLGVLGTGFDAGGTGSCPPRANGLTVLVLLPGVQNEEA